MSCNFCTDQVVFLCFVVMCVFIFNFNKEVNRRILNKIARLFHCQIDIHQRVYNQLLFTDITFFQHSRRPNGNVTDHMRSHVMDVKLKHIAALQEEVKRREQATEQLQHEVSCFRNHVTSLSLKLQSIREHNMDCELLDRISAKVIVLSNRVCTC